MTLDELNQIKKDYSVIEISVDFLNHIYKLSRSKISDSSRYVLCTLTENGVPRSVKTLETARIRMKKPDGTSIYNDCDVIEGDGRVLIHFTEQMLAVAGNAICDIQLFNTTYGVTYATYNFTLHIEDTPVKNTIIESTSEFTALTNLLKDFTEIDIRAITTDEIDSIFDSWKGVVE